MKLVYELHRYNSIFALGFETWIPRHNSWKKLELSIIVWRYYLSVTIGSKRQYLEERKLSGEHGKDLWQ